ncbi:ankyrin repeat domain-containing protein [bacterium]|nr:MAG: ankyrin repeat domain-containing protein [bacterium]
MERAPFTLLFVTARGVPLLKLLVENGADVSARDNAGATPLDVATERGDQKAVDFLKSL